MSQQLDIILLNAGKKSLDGFSLGSRTLRASRHMADSLFFLIDSDTKLFEKNNELDVRNKLIYNRFDRNPQFTGLILEFSKLKGARIINEALLCYKNGPEKIAQMMRAGCNNIKTPKSVITLKNGFKHNEEAILRHLNFPIVYKLDGMKGEAVSLLNTIEELRAEYETISDQEVTLLQEYIPNSYDVRMIMSQGVCIGAIKRIGGDKFLNNVSQGGQVEMHHPSEQELDIAHAAMKMNESEIAGVDLIHKNTTPLFLELNHGFGVEGFEQVHTSEKTMTTIAKTIESKYATDL